MSNISAISRRIALICGFCLLCAPAAEAQRSRRGVANQVARRLQKEIQQIQKQLPEAQEELGKADKSLAQAQVQFRQAQAEIEQARRSLASRVGPKVGLPDALAAAEQAEKAYEDASSEFVRDHRDDPTLKQLRQKHVEAEARLNAFRKDKPGHEDERKEKLASVTKAAHEARDAYQSRIDGDPAVKPAYERWKKAEARMNEVRKKLSQETKDDPELKSAEAGFKQAKAAFEQAEAVAAAAGSKVALMQERIATNLTLLGN